MGIWDILESIKLEVGRQLAPWWSRQTLPMLEGTYLCEGLEQDVTVRRDKWGVPHITASSLSDLAFAQGFVHSQDRFWQMDLARRMGSGMLAEILGDKVVDVDKFARICGWRRVAVQDWDDIQKNNDETVLTMYKAYAAGVNHYLKQAPAQPSVEFRLLGYTPEPWTEVDTCTLARLLCYRMSFGWQHELVRLKMIRIVGAENARLFDISHEKTPAQMPDEEVLRLLDLDSVISLDSLPKEAKAMGMATGQGSNAWSVHGSRTSTGKPILSNDTHLQLSIPNTMYENHLRVVDAEGKELEEEVLHVTGVSLVGVPLIVIGHNPSFAWGVTLGYADGQDLYVERFESDKSLRYQVDDENKEEPEFGEAEAIREDIKVKDAATVEFEVIKTRHGTIISDCGMLSEMSKEAASAYSTDNEGEKQFKLRVALASANVLPDLDIVGTFFKLCQGKNFKDFCAAAEKIVAPPLNVPYADVHGDIGYYMTGTVPLRPEGNTGLLPSPGWKRANDWGPRIPFEHMPHSHNPEKGYIVSTNQKPTGEKYPYYLGSIFRQGYRARVIDKELAKNDKVSVDFCKTLQMNTYDLVAEEFFELFDKLGVKAAVEGDDDAEGKSGDEGVTLNFDAQTKAAWDRMRAWDHNLSTDCVGGTIFHTFLHYLVWNTLRAGIKSGLKDNAPVGQNTMTDEEVDQFVLTMIGQSLIPPITPLGSSFRCRREMSIYRMLEDSTGWWVAQSGGLAQLLTTSFNSAYELITTRLGENPDEWRWGRLHTLRLDHPFTAKFGPRPFSRGPVEVPGSPTTVFLMNTNSQHDKYPNCEAGPVYRQVIDMSDFRNCYSLIAGGQSGHLASPHYNDQTEMLIKGEFHPMLWAEEDVAAHTQHTLTLSKGGQ